MNTAHAHTWAAVVSGTAWKRHTLEDGGTLTAEYVRGPVIVWASTGLEGYSKFVSEAMAKGTAKAESAPRLTLEEHIDHLNTAQVFERFRWAARGKVRHSVRWKTGTRRRRFRKLEALEVMSYLERVAERRAAGKHGFMGHAAPRTAKARREARKFWEAERLEDRLRDIAPAWADEDNPSGIDLDRLEWWNFWGAVLRRNHGEERGKPYPPGFHMPESRPGEAMQPDTAMAAFFVLMGKTQELACLLAHMRAKRPTLGQLLKDLQAAEYRAHLTRRVKPAPRRHRIRRPLHSRPRPPSAPLAPPVL